MISRNCANDKRFEHDLLRPPITPGSPRNAASSPGVTSLGSASERCAAIFENEVNTHVASQFPSSLTGCKFSGFRNREIIDEATGVALLEMDTFGYILQDNLEDGKEMTPSGIYLILPEGIGDVQKSAPTPSENPGGSPGAKGTKACAGC
jgi:hypothetical protein